MKTLLKNISCALILSVLLIHSMQAGVVVEDSLALVALYNSTNGPQWTRQNSWLSGDVSTWYGVDVLDSHVHRLFLQNINLRGTLPPDIGNLSKITQINITNHINLTGSIPPEIGNLQNLETLELFSNGLTESIPASIGHLSKLEILYLPWNRLSGEIPATIGHLINLTELDLGHNELTGAIPAQIKDLSKLKILKIDHNYFYDFPNVTPITTLDEVMVQNNKLTFEDIIPNLSIPNFTYSPQDSVGIAIDTTVTIGSTLTLYSTVGGTANQYQWTHNGSEVAGAQTDVLFFDSIQPSDSGIYFCKITNRIATALTIYRRPIKVRVTTDAWSNEFAATIPTEFMLWQNHPNPFNPQTTITYQLPKASRVSLTIYNLMGHQVRSLKEDKQQPGYYSIRWDGTDADGNAVSSGTYFYRLKTEEFEGTKKLLIIR